LAESWTFRDDDDFSFRPQWLSSLSVLAPLISFFSPFFMKEGFAGLPASALRAFFFFSASFFMRKKSLVARIPELIYTP